MKTYMLLMLMSIFVFVSYLPVPRRANGLLLGLGRRQRDAAAQQGLGDVGGLSIGAPRPHFRCSPPASAASVCSGGAGSAGGEPELKSIPVARRCSALPRSVTHNAATAINRRTTLEPAMPLLPDIGLPIRFGRRERPHQSAPSAAAQRVGARTAEEAPESVTA
jgi:hypothetical protein